MTVLLAVLLVQGDGLHVQQVRQGLDAGLAAGGALVDRLAPGDGLGIGSAAGVAALAALGLGQDIVDLVGDGVALGLEAHRGEAQQGAEHRAEADQGQQCRQQRVLGMISAIRSPAVDADTRPRKAHEGQRHQARR